MLVTAQTLENLKACKDQIETFSQAFPDGCETEEAENLYSAEKECLNIAWAIDKQLVSRQVCLEKPHWAYYYALYVDKQSKK